MTTVHVWWADLRAADVSAASRLPAAERARLEELDDDAARGRRLVGELVLQRALRHARALPDDVLVEIDRTCAECGAQHGRPVAADGAGPWLSVTHAGVLVAVATCEAAAVGIDVDRASADWVAAEARVKAAVADPDLGTTVPLVAPLPGYAAALAVAGRGEIHVEEHFLTGAPGRR